MTQKLEFGALTYVTLLFDGTSKTIPGNFIGIYGIPPYGSYEWWAVNGDCGNTDSEDEAIAEIENSWKGDSAL